MEDDTFHADSNDPFLNLTAAASSGVTPLEQEVLDEYERLLRNMNQVSFALITNP
jgi:hypothetical protein